MTESDRLTLGHPPTHVGAAGMRRLLEAVLAIGSEHDLDRVLERVVEAAVDLVDARYGALGVIDDTRGLPTRFVAAGIDESTRHEIGDVPSGLGFLGSLVTDARPLRLARLADHPDSATFPPDHPPMTTFLGVPIRVGDERFATLYLVDKKTSEVFSDIDEELAVALAAAAGLAIDNARLHALAQRRDAALAAMRDLATALGDGDGVGVVARQARRLLAASGVAVAVPASPTELRWDAVDGAMPGVVRDGTLELRGSLLGEVLEAGAARAVVDGAARLRGHVVDAGPALAAPLLTAGRPTAVMVAVRHRGGPPFTADDVDLAGAFVAQASALLDRSLVDLRVAPAEPRGPEVDCPVVVVDDDELARTLVVRHLRKLRLGNPVIEAVDAEAAYDVLSRRDIRPALVLLDMAMPGQSGLDVLRWIRRGEWVADLPVVMLTGSAELDEVEAAYALGIDSYLVKPVGFGALDDVLRQIALPWAILPRPSTPPGGAAR